MHTLAGDPKKTVAVFINDFYQEFADALPKLEKILGRRLQPVALVDARVKAAGLNTIDAPCREMVVDFADDASLRRAVMGFEDQLLLVTCSADGNQPYLQRVLPFLPYALGPTESSLTWATHKGMMRGLMGGFDDSLVPKYQMIESAAPSELRKVTERLHFPVIVKPTGLAASILVSRAENAAELRRIAGDSFRVLGDVYRRDHGRGNPAMIVEEFIVGDMYTIDAYVNAEGQVWTLPFLRAHTAHTVGRIGFYEYQADSHTELTAAEDYAGRVAAEKAIHAVGLRSCVAHIEMYLTDSGWKIIELGPRAGGQRQDIYWASFGIDHALNELLLKIGLEPDVTARKHDFSTTVYLYADVEGTITNIEGVEEARRNPSIYNLHVRAEVGHVAQNSQNGGKWLVRGLLTNRDKDQLYRDAEAVRSLIQIKTRPHVRVNV